MEGTSFGRYRLVELLGRGGMGEVWRAHDTDTNRVVALKLLPPALAKNHEYEERFRREARAVAGLNDPHIVPLHNFGEIDGRLYLDMRLIDGQDLDALLGKGPLDPARAVTIVEHVAVALHAAHRIGLVHRDVKPSNILITEFDFAYLIDFGIASAAEDSGLTGTGMMIGTTAYMAPERFQSGRSDWRADIYALACVLHECLTGQPPFPGTTVAQLATAHMFTPPPTPSTVRAGLTPAWDDVIRRGMAKSPADRYQSALDLARAARAALVAPPPAPPAAPPTRAAQTQYQPHPPSAFPPAPPTMHNPGYGHPGPVPAVQPPRRTGLLIGGAIAGVVLVVVGLALVVRWSSQIDSYTTTPSPRASTTRQSTSTTQSTTHSAVAPLGTDACVDVTGANFNLLISTTTAQAKAAADVFAKYDPPPDVQDAIDHFVQKGGARFTDPDYEQNNKVITDWVHELCPQ